MLYRAALIGCGNIGSQYADDPLIKGVYTHAGAYAACPETELVAVCDLDLQSAEVCASKWNVPAVYSDLINLLKEQRPQIVSVCTPDATHAAVIEQVLNSEGVLAVLVEKPLALDAEQGRDLLQLAQEKNIILAVNYSRRYAEGHQKAKACIESGAIGEIQSISGYYTKGIFHNGTHWLDLARWLAGDVVSLQGFCIGEESTPDPMLAARLGFTSGASGFVQPLNAEAFSLFEMDVIGIKGRVRLIDSGHRIKLYTAKASPYYSGYDTLLRSDEFDGGLNHAMLNAVQDLVRCIQENKQPICSGQDGLIALEMAAQITASAITQESANLLMVGN